jgi:hypothetical protein
VIREAVKVTNRFPFKERKMNTVKTQNDDTFEFQGNKFVDVDGKRYVKREDVRKIFEKKLDLIQAYHFETDEHEEEYAAGLKNGTEAQKDQLDAENMGDGAFSIGCMVFDEAETKVIRKWANGHPEADFWLKLLKDQTFSVASLEKAAKLKSPHKEAIKDALKLFSQKKK